MGFRLFVIWLGTLCLPPMVGAAFTGAASPRSAPFRVRVISAKDGKPLQAAVTTLAPYGLWAVAGTDGEALFADVPPGKAELSVSLLGYETVSLTVELKAETEDSVRIAMMPSSFAMKEVVVVAENNKSGLSTSSSIGRQALDHLQATSLKDVLQLLPGNFLGSNPSLISTGQFRNRTLEADNNNAFGGSIVVDGIPLSNNANLNVEAGAFSTAGKGIDLRGIGTDNIESIEVIRGIASARYGDMSSGTMLIKSKVGRAPGRVLARIMPGIQQLYADKGFDLGRAGTLNLSADYAHGKSDPRYATDTYNRGLLSLIHSKNLADGRWAVTTRLGLKLIRDWSGADPGEPELVRGMYAQSRQYGITFSHSGRFGADSITISDFRTAATTITKSRCLHRRPITHRCSTRPATRPSRRQSCRPSTSAEAVPTDARSLFMFSSATIFTWDRKDFSIESPSEPNCAARGISDADSTTRIRICPLHSCVRVPFATSRS